MFCACFVVLSLCRLLSKIYEREGYFYKFLAYCISDELVRVVRRYLFPEIADMRGTKPMEGLSNRF